MSDKLLEAAGAFFESIGGVLQAKHNHVIAGRSFDKDTLTIAAQVAMSLDMAIKQTNSPGDFDNLNLAIRYFAPDSLSATYPAVPVDTSAANLYENVTSIIRYFYKAEFSGSMFSDSARSLLSQISHSVRKVILYMGTELNPADPDDKLLGDALNHYIPKGSHPGVFTPKITGGTKR